MASEESRPKRSLEAAVAGFGSDAAMLAAREARRAKAAEVTRVAPTTEPMQFRPQQSAAKIEADNAARRARAEVIREGQRVSDRIDRMSRSGATYSPTTPAESEIARARRLRGSPVVSDYESGPEELSAEGGVLSANEGFSDIVHDPEDEVVALSSRYGEGRRIVHSSGYGVDQQALDQANQFEEAENPILRSGRKGGIEQRARDNQVYNPIKAEAEARSRERAEDRDAFEARALPAADAIKSPNFDTSRQTERSTTGVRHPAELQSDRTTSMSETIRAENLTRHQTTKPDTTAGGGPAQSRVDVDIPEPTWTPAPTYAAKGVDAEYLNAVGLGTVGATPEYMVASAQRQNEWMRDQRERSLASNKFNILRTAADRLVESAPSTRVLSQDQQSNVADTVARYRMFAGGTGSPAINEDTAAQQVGDARSGALGLPSASAGSTQQMKLDRGEPKFVMVNTGETDTQTGDPVRRETNKIAMEPVKNVPVGQEMTGYARKKLASVDKQQSAIPRSDRSTPAEREARGDGVLSRQRRLKVLNELVNRRQIASMTASHAIATEQAALTGARPPMPLSLTQRLAQANAAIQSSINTMMSTSESTTRKRGSDMAGAGSAETPGGRRPSGLVPKNDAGGNLPRIGEVEREGMSELRNKAISMGVIADGTEISDEELKPMIMEHIQNYKKGSY